MTLRSYFGKSTQPSGPLCLWRCPQIGWWSEHQNIARQSSVNLRHFTFSSVMIWVLNLARIVIDVTYHWDHSTVYIEYTESSDCKRCQPDNIAYWSALATPCMYITSVSSPIIRSLKSVWLSRTTLTKCDDPLKIFTVRGSQFWGSLLPH